MQKPVDRSCKEEIKKQVTTRKGYFAIRRILLSGSFIYVFMGFLMIYFLHNLLKQFKNDELPINSLILLKGIAFFLITSILLYILSQRHIHAISRIQQKAEEEILLNKKIVDDLTDGLWEYHPNTNEYIFSPKWKKMMGYEDHEIKNCFETWKNLLHPDDLNNVLNILKKTLAKHTPKYEAEYRMRAKNGQYRWFLTRGQAFYDEKGKLVRLIGTRLHITDRKKMEENLRKSEKKFRKLFYNANDPIFLYEFPENGIPDKFIEVNNIACKKLGYSRNEFLNMCPADMIPKQKLEETLHHIYKLLTQDHITFETVFITKEGMEFPVELSCHFFLLDGQRVVLTICRDITERKKYESNLRNMMRENEKLLLSTLEYDRLKTEFFSNLSHEFKTPINVILGATQLLNIHVNNNEKCKNCIVMNKNLKVMKQNCYRLLRLINNLIDITQVDSGFMKLNLYNCNIINIVEDITLSVVPFAESKSIELQFDTETEEKMMACDVDKIE